MNKESTNENNTDVDCWVDARRLRINGKPCSQSYSCTGSAIRIRRCCGGGHNMRLPLTIKPRRCLNLPSPLHRSHWNRIYRGIEPKVAPKVAPMSLTISTHVYEVRRRKDKRGVDLISDALRFGRLVRWAECRRECRWVPLSTAAGAHDAAIRVYDDAGNAIETHEHKSVFKEA